MKNLDKITAMKVIVEFNCYGRTAFIEVSITAADMVSIGARKFIDDRIAAFLAENKPGMASFGRQN